MTSPDASSEALPPVLIVDLSKQYGGSVSRVLSLMEEFPPVHIGLVALQDSAISKMAKKRNLQVYEVARHKADPRILKRLISIIRSGGYRIIDAQNIQSKFWGSLAASMTGAALVSTLNSWYADEHGGNSIKGKIYTALELMTNFSLDRYVTVSDMDRRSLLAAGQDGELVDLIYNAVTIDTKKVPLIRLELVERYHLPADAILCTTAGRLVWAKGYDDLINAFAILSQQNSRLHCLIAGDGELMPELQKMISDGGLQQRVQLIGYQEHETILAMVKSSDVFVMPSKHEGTPIALLEAAALGCPIVASRCGGIPELVADEEHALLVPAGEPQALAAALQRLSSDKALAERLAKRAQKRIETQFNLTTQVAGTKQAYRKAWQHRNSRTNPKRRTG